MTIPYSLPLSIRQDGLTPVVTLGGIEVAGVLAADGVRIEYVDLCRTVGGAGLSVPQVTLTFGPGALELDFEVDLLQRLLAEKAAG